MRTLALMLAAALIAPSAVFPQQPSTSEHAGMFSSPPVPPDEEQVAPTFN